MSTPTIPKNWLWKSEAVGSGRVVIFDLDGVLCNADGRQHFIRSTRKDWKAFFEACSEDTLIEETARLLRLLATDVTVVLLTGRPIEVQSHTLSWLKTQDLPWDLLIMRNRGDYEDSTVFKQQSVRKLKSLGFDVQVAFDDDPQNQEMFEAEGVPCHYRYSGYYEERDAVKSKAN
jgi:phosphoglycolate phosphatase-like HAD superfamily hydrolase